MNPGARVELVRTDDEYTSLRPGSRGTLVSIQADPFVNGETITHVDWDDGSNLSMLSAAGDLIKEVSE